MRSISDYVDMGLEVATAETGAGPLATVGAVLLGAAAIGALKILPASHVDHGLSDHDLEWLKDKYRDAESFFIETCTLPGDDGWCCQLPGGPPFGPSGSGTRLPCGLHGPAAGDLPVLESDVHYRVRGNRKNASRLVNRPTRPTRQVTVIAGPAGDEPCVLYTAYGGPEAPREPGDTSIQSWDEVQKSRKFWADHALSDQP
jgi:hypothetical protein